MAMISANWSCVGLEELPKSVLKTHERLWRESYLTRGCVIDKVKNALLMKEIPDFNLI